MRRQRLPPEVQNLIAVHRQNRIPVQELAYLFAEPQRVHRSLVGVLYRRPARLAVVLHVPETQYPVRLYPACPVCLAALRLPQQLRKNCLSVPHDAQVNVPVVPELAWLYVNLNYLGVRVEPVTVLDHPIQPGPDNQHQVRFAHRGASGGWERNGVVFWNESSGHWSRIERRGSQINESLQFRRRAGEEGSPSREYHRTLRGGEHVHHFTHYFRLGGGAGAPGRARRMHRILFLDLFIKYVRAAVNIDRTRSPGCRLAERHAHYLRVARGLCGLVDPLHHRLHDADLVHFLEGLASDLVNRTRSAENYHGRAVNSRGVNAGQ